MTYETIVLEEDTRGIATLTLNRPDKHNALSAQMIAELTEVAGAISESKTIRVVILAGEGKSFCAGGDLGWMKAQTTKSDDEKVKEGMKLATMLQALDDLPKPLIAKVEGSAFGGGLGMMCVSDIVIAANRAKFGLTETKLGLIPATIGPYVVRRLGEGHARRVFMNSAIFDTEEALRIGLISKAVFIEDLDQAALIEAEAFLNCAPNAVADAKTFCKTLARTTDNMKNMSAEALAGRWKSPESHEGIAAFFEKRKPSWAPAENK